ncbi:MAG TPA: hypothetical protein VM638_00065 [Actinomycetota bacterium]|nr:hypothetical protein [Actinomycetota bacterium]
MNEQLTTRDREAATEPADGLLLAPVKGRSAWDAVQALRAEMQRLAASGEPHATFVTAIATDGREVTATDPAAEVLALGYEVRPAARAI